MVTISPEIYEFANKYYRLIDGKGTKWKSSQELAEYIAYIEKWFTIDVEEIKIKYKFIQEWNETKQWKFISLIFWSAAK